MELAKMTTRLLVKDFKACFNFYKDVLGLEPTWGDEKGPYASFGKGQTEYLSLFDSAFMTAYEGYVQPSCNCIADKAVLCIPTDDVDRDFQKLSAVGVSFIGKPQTIPAWYMRCVYFRDPEGNLLELYQGVY